MTRAQMIDRAVINVLASYSPKVSPQRTADWWLSYPEYAPKELITLEFYRIQRTRAFL